MSKPIKKLIIDSYKKRFGDLEGAVLIEIRSIKSNQANQLRGALATKKIKVTVVKNNLAKQALAGTKLEKISDLLTGAVGLVYGGDSVVAIARALVDTLKEIETLKFRGAIMDGLIFPADKIEELSKYPTKTEAQAQVLTLVLSPAKKVAGQILGPGRKLAALVKAIEEKKKNETPAAAA